MSDRSLHQLMAWLSPSYPIGSFSYSHGLEYAIEAGDVRNGEDLRRWLIDIVERGSGYNDAVLLCHAYRARTREELCDIADLAEALCSSRERHIETMAQGAAFAKITSDVWGIDLKPAPLPIVFGAAIAHQSISLETALPLYLHAFISNIITMAVRHIPLGQTDGQLVLASLFEQIDDVSHHASNADVNDLGNSCFLADLASMQHETMDTRIFRT